VLAKNALRTLSFEHDRLGRVVAVQDPAFLGTLRRSFDADGRMTQVLYPTTPDYGFPQGVVTRFEYDPRGQLTGVRDPSGRWDHSYDALGRLLETCGPSGVAQRRSYTPEGFLDRADTTLAGGGSEAIVYSQYDATVLPGRIVTSEGTTQLGYHARGWLESISYPDGTSEAFGYDLVGNRTTQTPRTGPPRVYRYGAADQLRFVFAGTGFEQFDYDGAGRRITKTPGTDTAEQTRYEYDALGRLTEVEQPGQQVHSRTTRSAASARCLRRGREPGHRRQVYIEQREGEPRGAGVEKDGFQDLSSAGRESVGLVSDTGRYPSVTRRSISVAVTTGMPSYLPRLNRSPSPETTISASAARAQAMTWSSSGSRTTRGGAAGLTMCARARSSPTISATELSTCTIRRVNFSRASTSSSSAIKAALVNSVIVSLRAASRIWRGMPPYRNADTTTLVSATARIPTMYERAARRERLRSRRRSLLR